MSDSSSDDELSHFKPSGLLYGPKSNHLEALKAAATSSTATAKYFECEDSADPSRFPVTAAFKLFVFKGSEVVENFDLSRRSYFRLGRDSKINHILLLHESCSSQHAVLQYRLREGRCRLYLLDLGSSNGTLLNGKVKVESERFYEILDGDVVKFAASTRDYVFMKNKQ